MSRSIIVLPEDSAKPILDAIAHAAKSVLIDFAVLTLHKQEIEEIASCCDAARKRTKFDRQTSGAPLNAKNYDVCRNGQQSAGCSPGN